MRAVLVGLIALVALAAAPAGAADLRVFEGCTLIPTEWADGDSFQVEFPGGRRHTVRLYGADCIELHVADDSDARRLRAQRRYFGISGFGGSPENSIAKAKSFGAAARNRVRELLGKDPFTVITAFADARGDGKHQRFYGFVRLDDGRDLAEVLVAEGLARAFGVYRGRPGAFTQDELRERLGDLELKAAKLGTGAWGATDWELLPGERKAERDEEAALAAARGGAPDLEERSVNPNSAARDQLMKLPRIGETIANRIIEGRTRGSYTTPEDLSRIQGIGDKTISLIRPYLAFEP